MRLAAVAKHLATVVIALAVGFFGQFGYGIGCFYERSPFGSACDDGQALTIVVSYALAAACVLYAIWGAILLVRYLSD